MRTLLCPQLIKYNGEQLKSLNNYLVHKLLGDSIVGFRGSCDIPFEHMIDGEDVVLQSPIRGDDMLHFIVELFQVSLIGAVGFQRLMSELAVSTLRELTATPPVLIRKGDDLYHEGRKLNISIATVTSNSALIHWALNISNEGTPVPTCSLSDFGVSWTDFGSRFLEKVASEWEDMREASQKVRPL